jgi:hypothetical protein
MSIVSGYHVSKIAFGSQKGRLCSEQQILLLSYTCIFQVGTSTAYMAWLVIPNGTERAVLLESSDMLLRVEERISIFIQKAVLVVF